LCLWLLLNSSPPISVTFSGFTNNTASLLGTSDKVLAVFTVTNRGNSSFADSGFYYIETSGQRMTYAPLGSAGAITPHGCGMLITRVSTNGAPWRVIIPYTRSTGLIKVVDAIHDAADRKLGKPNYNFERFGEGAPTSDWVKDTP
jgi:hypothetical protein